MGPDRVDPETVDEVGRWPMTAVRPQLRITTDDPVAVLAEAERCLGGQGFRVRERGAGRVVLRRRPWLDWLATAPSESCALELTVVDGGVLVDVRRRGGRPAPQRAAAGLSATLAAVRERGAAARVGAWTTV